MLLPLRDVNPTRRFPIVTVLIIAVNTAVFFIQALSPQGLEVLILRMGAVPYEFTHFTSLSQVPRIPAALTLLTSMFLHAGLFHLLGNMLYFWIFGNNVEDFLGPARFILFYLFSGLGAALTHIAFNPSSQVPMVGASGAIAGVLGGYFLLYPRARVDTLIFLFVFIRVVPVPAALVLGFWFLAQFLNIGLGGGVAWFAHIGGFLVGAVLIKALSPRRKPAQD